MIPHISKLQNVLTLDDFNQYYKFKKQTNVIILPTIYDEASPYDNTINDKYYMIISCDSLSSDTGYSKFLKKQLSDSDITKYSSYSIAVFLIEDNKINLIDIKSTNITYSLNINFESKQNIVTSGPNVIGIISEVNNVTYANLTLNYGSTFTITTVYKAYTEQYVALNKKYRYPDLYDQTYTTLNANNVRPYYFTYNQYSVDNSIGFKQYTNAGNISYSNDLYSTKSIAGSYAREAHDHFVPNIKSDEYIAIPYKYIPQFPDSYIDVYINGSRTKYLKKNISSIQWIKDNEFQVVKNYKLYSCNLEQTTGAFYNYKLLEDLNTYSNGTIKHHINIIKIGNTIVSEKYGDTGIYMQNTWSAMTTYINGISMGDYSKLPYVKTYNYEFLNVTYSEDKRIKFSPIQPAYYEFNSFIIFPRKSLIITTDVLRESYVKTVNNSTLTKYVANKQHDSIVKIGTIGNVTIAENDATLISSSGNNSFYRMKSNIALNSGANISSIQINNNIGDTGGALKHVSYDATNDIIAKIDPYEFSENWDKLTFELNVNIDEIEKLVINDNKFIKFINASDSYYIMWGGYKFTSLSDLKNNFYNILDTHFKYDEIKLNDFTNSNVNYINDIVAIQRTINKKLNAVYNGDTQLSLNYNFISISDILTTATDQTNNISTFKIDYFIDADGTIYPESGIDYKLYNLNKVSASTFKVICTVNVDYIKNYKYNALIKSSYTIEDISVANNSYNTTSILEIATVTGSTNIDATTSTATITDGTIEITSSDTSCNLDYFITNATIANDEMLNINIAIKDSTIDTNVSNDDVFSSLKINDFLDLHIKDDVNHNILHFDLVGKTCNIYTLYLTAARNFYTFGNLPSKCKSWISLQYDRLNTDTNIQYGPTWGKTLNNLMEQNSGQYFTPRQIAAEAITPPQWDDWRCDGHDIVPIDNTSTYTTQQSCNVWPVDKEAHTLIGNMPMSYIADIKTDQNSSFTNGTYTGEYLALYGFNYGAYILGQDASTCYTGLNIRPPYNLFNKNNLNGYDIWKLYHEDTTTSNVQGNDHNLYYIFNKYSDSTTYSMEQTYFDGTNSTGLDIKYNRIMTDTSGLPIYSYVNHGAPILNIPSGLNKVRYMTPSVGTTDISTYSGGQFNHLIDFDYQLSPQEIEYFQTHLYDILTKMFIEKRKNGTTYDAATNDFGFKYMSTGSYIYNISRSNINIKFIKKYNFIYIYVNDILVEEIYTQAATSKISDIVNYGNNDVGKKVITFSKHTNVITKKSGFWC